MVNRIKSALFFALSIFLINACDQKQSVTDINQVKPDDEHSVMSGDSIGGSSKISQLIKSAFPEDASINLQKRKLTDEILKQAEPTFSPEHEAYFAFSSESGTRKQIGAATLLKIADKEIAVIYESKNGMPTISRLLSTQVPKDFLNQFISKTHDDPIKLGADIKKVGGINEQEAEQITKAIRSDVLIMQALYGKPHSH
ncbi:MAG: hypothetical protein D6735_07955 [Acidobacteria bacterium]|nr:MAG: hypothetical protein D6735_07955 [Acidobacteriota bacterium]